VVAWVTELLLPAPDAAGCEVVVWLLVPDPDAAGCEGVTVLLVRGCDALPGSALATATDRAAPAISEPAAR
jgi:hypothetical protein